MHRADEAFARRCQLNHTPRRCFFLALTLFSRCSFVIVHVGLECKVKHVYICADTLRAGENARMREWSSL